MLFQTEMTTASGAELLVETHHLPQGEEIMAMCAVDWCATKKWVKDNCPDAVLQLGIGDGKFDDHSDKYTEEEQKKISSFSLVAESLGIKEREEMAHYLQFFNFEDNNRTKDRRNLANVFWLMQK